MSVYVDKERHHFGRMVMCHMIADTSAELREMARRIGVAEKWIQKEGTEHEHFDICLAKRAKAIEAGALEVGRQKVVDVFNAKRTAIRIEKERREKEAQETVECNLRLVRHEDGSLEWRD